MPRTRHYWIVAEDSDGRHYLIYGGISEDAARMQGLSFLGGANFDIKMFPTTDMDTASAMFRGKRLVNGDGLRKSTQRIGHEKSIQRRINRSRR